MIYKISPPSSFKAGCPPVCGRGGRIVKSSNYIFDELLKIQDEDGVVVVQSIKERDSIAHQQHLSPENNIKYNV